MLLKIISAVIGILAAAGRALVTYFRRNGNVATAERRIGFAARIAKDVGDGRIPVLVQIWTLCRLPRTNSPRMPSASASPYEGATSNHVTPASSARLSAMRPSRRLIREPSEAQPMPITEAVLVRLAIAICCTGILVYVRWD